MRLVIHNPTRASVRAPPSTCRPNRPSGEAANEGGPRFNDSEREALLLNIDVSLRVHTRPQLFSWVQARCRA